jgi:hypothetical protein
MGTASEEMPKERGEEPEGGVGEPEGEGVGPFTASA